MPEIVGITTVTVSDFYLRQKASGSRKKRWLPLLLHGTADWVLGITLVMTGTHLIWSEGHRRYIIEDIHAL